MITEDLRKSAASSGASWCMFATPNDSALDQSLDDSAHEQSANAMLAGMMGESPQRTEVTFKKGVRNVPPPQTPPPNQKE